MAKGKMDCRRRGGGIGAAEEKGLSEKFPARKRGGSIPGAPAMERPDKRARGGSVRDPFTAAHKVSSLPFMKAGAGESEPGKGGDRD